jgi:hypothetical protein
MTNDLIFRHNYTQADIAHSIDALVIVTNLTSLNSSSINSISPHSNLSTSNESLSVESTTSSDVLLSTISDPSNHLKFSYEILANASLKDVSFDCQNKEVSMDSGTHSTYGLFSQKIEVIGTFYRLLFRVSSSIRIFVL